MYKICCRCREKKNISEFKKCNTSPSGIGSWCKQCHSKSVASSVNRRKANENNKRYKKTEKGKIVNLRYKRARRAVHRKARPPWACRQAIDNIYNQAREIGMAVDHIVPLRHPDVCGLHTQENLMLLDHGANQAKGNRWWPDSWMELS